MPLERLCPGKHQIVQMLADAQRPCHEPVETIIGRQVGQSRAGQGDDGMSSKWEARDALNLAGVVAVLGHVGDGLHDGLRLQAGPRRLHAAPGRSSGRPVRMVGSAWGLRNIRLRSLSPQLWLCMRLPQQGVVLSYVSALTLQGEQYLLNEKFKAHGAQVAAQRAGVAGLEPVGRQVQRPLR